ncbi:MAG TPA: TraU family protein [Planctomycetota bacterium]|nr:TraU family protein [Planctomycetota bacterium]
MPPSFTKFASLAASGLLAAVGAWAQSARKPDSVGPLPFEGADSVTSVLGRTDASLVLRSWKAKGILACTHGFDVRVCLWVENAYPSGIFEVLRQPYKTQLAEMRGMIQGLEPAAWGPLGSSSHSPFSGDGTALQFGEARVYTYVPDLGLYQSDVPVAVPSRSQFQPDYVSELDRLGWRSPWVDRLTCPETILAGLKSCGGAPDPVTCAGTWGSYYPRIGGVVHPSPAVGAALQALRAGRAASRPLGRAVLSTYDYEPRTGHYLQMIEPVAKLGISIGSPFPEALDLGAGSRYGNYLFVHFGIFEYCSGCLPVRLVEERPPQ